MGKNGQAKGKDRRKAIISPSDGEVIIRTYVPPPREGGAGD